jgi:hypothetical protein
MFLTTACQARRLWISVPLVELLLDNQKYFLPDALPAPSGDDLRPMLQPRIAKAKPPRPRPHRKTWRARDLAELDTLIGKV